MIAKLTANRLGLVGALAATGAMLLSCRDAPVAPTAAEPSAAATATLHSMHSMHDVTVPLASISLEPFSYRAPLDPYKIQQLPDFMVHSNVRSDIVMQRSVFAPGPGPWHTHPGPSFVYVIQGEIKLQRHSRKDGCTETPVHTAGSLYNEVAEEVHRAVVVSAEPAVVLVTRFNIPVGSPITIPAADPGC